MHRVILKSAFFKKHALKPFSSPGAPLQTNVERLLEIEHDLLTVPQIFCDSITEEPMNQPLMIDVADHHAIDASTLPAYLKGEEYLNPHNRIAILTPQTFNAKAQKNLKNTFEKIVVLPTLSSREKEILANEITETRDCITQKQQALLDLALDKICKHNHHSQEEIQDLQSEMGRIEMHLTRYSKEEPGRAENEKTLKILFETYISSLKRIDTFKKKLSQSHHQDLSKSLTCIQLLTQELETFLLNTKPIIRPYEMESVLGKQEQYLANLKSLQPLLSRLKKIKALQNELTLMDNPKKNFNEKELYQNGYSQEEIRCIREYDVNEKKARLLSRLIQKLEKSIEQTQGKSEIEELLLNKQHTILQELMLSIAPKENIFPKQCLLPFRMNTRNTNLFGPAHYPSLFPAHPYSPVLSQNDEKEKEYSP